MTLPEAFVDSLKNQFDVEIVDRLLDAIHDHQPPISIRINPRKFKTGPDLEKVPWSSTGYYLKDRPIFTADPLFHSGSYYVQEASSMVLEAVITAVLPDHSIRALDLCSAPGGKSTHLLSILSDNDLLVANEVIKSRAGVLHENLTKWGSDNCFVTNSDPKYFSQLEGFFDLVVIDAPCSGEGMFRKDESAVTEWSSENIKLCAERQQRILADAWDCLCYDGVLIYSTCTFNRQENEAVLKWLTDSYEVEPVIPDLGAYEGIVDYELDGFKGFKLLPGLVKGEGFCFFAVRKKEGRYRWEPDTRKKKEKKSHKKDTKIHGMPGVLSEVGMITTERDGWLFGTRFYRELEKLRQHLNVIKSGVLLGERKKNKVVPAHELAMSFLVDNNYWPAVELSHQSALSYLMKEPFELSSLSPGYHLVTYEGVALGWINHLGNRSNNLYPSSWRILKDFRNGPIFSLQTL